MKQQKQIIVLVVLLVVGAISLALEQSPESGNGRRQHNRFRLFANQRRKSCHSLVEARQAFAKPITKRSAEEIRSAQLRRRLLLPRHLQPGDTRLRSPPPPPPPPPDPTLPPNMKFFGYGTVPNGTARRAFLTDGDEVYIVAEGDLFSRSLSHSENRQRVRSNSKKYLPGARAERPWKTLARST